jgi:hypothetical protein
MRSGPIRASASLHSEAVGTACHSYERNHWEPLLYEGALDELVAVMNTDLAAWAAEVALTVGPGT